MPAPKGNRALSELIAPRGDVAELAARYRSAGRVVVPGVLGAEAAAKVGQALQEWPRWALVSRIGGQHRDFDAAEMARMDPVRRAGFDELVGADARNGFQYLYERWPLYDPDYDVPLDVPALEAVRQMLRGGAFIELARKVTGHDAIAFADGQLTRYRRGHFLTDHDDEAEGKHRLAAYVLGMTPDWKPDYGGQLQFLGDDGASVADVFVPGFNTLSIFAVPQPHLVSAVASFVQASRLSITGWLRSAG
jgi:hypothetical protein